MNHFPVYVVFGQFLVILEDAATIDQPLPHGLNAYSRSNPALKVPDGHGRRESDKVMVARVERFHRDLDQGVTGCSIGAMRRGWCRFHDEKRRSFLFTDNHLQPSSTQG